MSATQAARRYVGVLLVIWLVVVAGSAVMYIQEVRRTALALAVDQARALLGKDVLYRRWNANVGGVYVPVSDSVQPNSYLTVARRDIRAEDGRLLTLVNPAYMTRMVLELQRETAGIRGHITSENPIRPENAPDAWERIALGKLGQGREEFWSVESAGGRPWLRLMEPLQVEKSCLECHANQGYKEGDLRGGIGVSIPLENIFALQQRQEITVAGVHGLLAVLGTAIIVVGGRRVLVQILSREQAEERLAISHTQLLAETEVRQALQQQLLEVQAAVEHATDAVAILSPTGAVRYINSAFTNLFGYGVRELERTGEIILYTDMEQALETLTNAAQGASSCVEAVMHTSQCRSFVALVRTSAIRDENHEVQGVLRVVTDISDRKKVEEELRRVATVDGLTQVYNRRYFNEVMDKEWHRALRKQQPIAVAMIDIDHFKKYNDGYGHLEGDECLKRVAAALQSAIKRPGDLLGRFGGEEFVVLLPETTIEGARSVAETLLANVRALQVSHEFSPTAPIVTISVGIASAIPERNTPYQALLERGDQALYRAKSGGRNRIEG